MEDKNFDEQFWDFLDRNLFAVKKKLFGLEDCVSQTEFDALKRKLEIANEELAEAQIIIESAKEKNLELESKLETAILAAKNFKSTLEDLQSDFSDLEDALNEKKNELGILKEDYKDLEEENQLYAKNFSELDAAYRAYQKLSYNVKFSLRGIFGTGETATIFMAGALTEGHLESLFDFTATEINQDAPTDEIEILRGLFDFVFNATNSGRREEIFTRLEVNVGDEFNSSTMRKISASRQSGTVQKISLQGYKHSASGNVVRQSLVEIG